MDGIHDLGGMQGFGAVEVEADEPVFHEGWERDALGVAFAVFASGVTNGAAFRHGIERMDPGHYLSSSYYEHWMTGIATVLVDKGIVTADELAVRAGGRVPLSRPTVVEGPDEVGVDRTEPRFGPGERVRVRERMFSGHTRCPRYLRGHTGVVVSFDGVFSVPDVEAHSPERRSEPTYAVRFDAAELWDGEAEPGATVTVTVGLWERYLESVG